MIKDMESAMNIIKAILYFGCHTKQRLYYTKLQLLLFYYTKEYFQSFGEKILKQDFLYDGYIPRLEGLDELLGILNLKGIVKIKNTEYGKCVETLVRLEESGYEDKELVILSRVMENFDDLTSREIVQKYFHPALQQGSIRTATKTILNFT